MKKVNSLLFVSRTALAVLCLSVASAVFFSPHFAFGATTVINFDDLPIGSTIEDFGFIDSTGGNGLQSAVSSDTDFISSPYSLRATPVATGGIYRSMATSTEGVVSTWVNMQTTANFTGFFMHVLDSVGEPGVLSVQQRSGADLILCDGVQFGEYVLSTWVEVFIEWRQSDLGDTESRCAYRVAGSPIVYSPWYNEGSGFGHITGINLVANSAMTHIMLDNLTIVDSVPDPEEFSSTWIDAILPNDDEILTGTSSVEIQSLWYVASSSIPDGATVKVQQFWRNIGKEKGTFEQEITAFDDLGTLNSFATMTATGTVDVYHSIWIETVKERPWWNPFASDVLTSQKIAEDYSKFHMEIVTPPEERRVQQQSLVTQNEIENVEQDPSEQVVDTSTDFFAQLMTKHPFAWIIQGRDVLVEVSYSATSTESGVLVLPLFSVLDYEATSSAISFEGMDSYTGSMVATSSPVLDGCEFLDDVLVISSSTTACGGLRTLTTGILYLLTVFFIGIIYWKVLSSGKNSE